MADTNRSWEKIFRDYGIAGHDFSQSPFPLSAQQIKRACQRFTATGEKEARILCKHDSREDRPDIFKRMGLFLLPVRNGRYVIIKGEGYVDIPAIDEETVIYESSLKFHLDTAQVGDSEMQHLDYAYASSLIRTFASDPSLVLTVRGRKYTPEFSFNVGNQQITAKSVQTEVDAGYEGKEQVVLIEAKNAGASNVIIRQMYYPYRQWQSVTQKKVTTLFFQKSRSDNGNLYSIWRFEFQDSRDYNSIKLVGTKKYRIRE